jgi:hypothetical protein
MAVERRQPPVQAVEIQDAINPAQQMPVGHSLIKAELVKELPLAPA